MIYIIYIYIYIHYTNSPVLESGNLGANIHRARNTWESYGAHLPFLAKTRSCFHADLLGTWNARLQVVVLSFHYITLHCITLHHITLHYIHCITLHYIRYTTLHHITLHYITLGVIRLNYVGKRLTLHEVS